MKPKALVIFSGGQDSVTCLGFALKEYDEVEADRKSTRLNSSHQIISYAVFCLKKKTTPTSVSSILSY